uniref:Arrestin_N domain-containing protein n=1 Tax=Heterorhabditis bacteriophora TaxID=37862 RepID=A0A1I7WEI1_HETBA
MWQLQVGVHQQLSFVYEAALLRPLEVSLTREETNIGHYIGAVTVKVWGRYSMKGH